MPVSTRRQAYSPLQPSAQTPFRFRFDGTFLPQSCAALTGPACAGSSAPVPTGLVDGTFLPQSCAALTGPACAGSSAPVPTGLVQVCMPGRCSAAVTASFILPLLQPFDGTCRPASGATLWVPLTRNLPRRFCTRLPPQGSPVGFIRRLQMTTTRPSQGLVSPPWLPSASSYSGFKFAGPAVASQPLRQLSAFKFQLSGFKFQLSGFKSQLSASSPPLPDSHPASQG